MIAAMIRRPALWPLFAISQYVSGLQITIRHLRSKDDRNPALQRRAHQLLRLDDLRIALRIDHQRDAHRLDSLMHPCIRKHISFVLAMRFAAIGFARLDEVVDSAVAAHERDIRSFAHRDAMRNPVHNQSLCALLPQLAIDRILARVNHVETVGRRRRLHMDVNRVRRLLCSPKPQAPARNRRLAKTSQWSPETSAAANATAPGPAVFTHRALFLRESSATSLCRKDRSCRRSQPNGLHQPRPPAEVLERDRS